MSPVSFGFSGRRRPDTPGLPPHDTPGFWEQDGYHLCGDPRKEQRYS